MDEQVCGQSELRGLGDLGGRWGAGRDGMRAGLLECITEFNNSSSHSTSRALVLGRWAEIHADGTTYVFRYVPHHLVGTQYGTLLSPSCTHVDG